MNIKFDEYPELTLEDFKDDLFGLQYPEEILDKLIELFYQHIEVQCREWFEQEYAK